MSTEEGREKKRGPKGGMKHQPGRGHDTRSEPERKRRFARKVARKRRSKAAAARKAWQEWDRLPGEVKKLLGPAGQPKMSRPRNDY